MAHFSLSSPSIAVFNASSEPGASDSLSTMIRNDRPSEGGGGGGGAAAGSFVKNGADGPLGVGAAAAGAAAAAPAGGANRFKVRLEIVRTLPPILIEAGMCSDMKCVYLRRWFL